jgi:small-conductance mechanosensitive channel
MSVPAPAIAGVVVLAQQVPDTSLSDACGSDPSWICETVLDASDSETAARTADFLVAKPLTILFIIVLAWTANRLVRRLVRRFVTGLSQGTMRRGIEGIRHRAPSALQSTGELGLRAAQRAETIGSVLRSFATAVIWSIASLMILSELGVNLGPLIAGAGVVGIALGFGAQSLVKDFLSGIFMLIEDQYGVGDIVDVGDATGTVEAITLRSTRLRDVNGTVWHVPNGEIHRVGNKSQEWARALLDVAVAYGTDLDRAQQVIKDVADEVWRDESHGESVLEEPEVWGVESLGTDGIIIRLVVKTRPSEQFKVMRELRARIQRAFGEHGIEVPLSRTLLVQGDGSGATDTSGAGTDPPPPAPPERPTQSGS